MLDELKKELSESAGLVGAMVGVILAIATWRAPEVVNTLLFRPGSDIEAIAAHRRTLLSGLITLGVLDSLLISIDPTLLSAFIRIRDGTIFNLAEADIVLTLFQTVALWTVAMTIVSLVGTCFIIARLVRR